MWDNVYLREMNESEFDGYLVSAISKYAADLIKCGIASDENALVLSRKDFNDALPKGFKTPKANFFSIFNNVDDKIGLIWYTELQGAIAYIGDFLINEQHRKKGYGFQTLTIFEKYILEKGLRLIVLNVFEHNIAARSLYEKMGYVESKAERGCIEMVKILNEK